MGKKQRERKLKKIEGEKLRKEEIKKKTAGQNYLNIFKSVKFYLIIFSALAIIFYPFVYNNYIPHGRYAILKTSMGDIKIELYSKKAPNTVDNFKSLANSDFYKNLTWHRVVNTFIIQSGDPTATGTGGPGYEFNDEINDIKFDPGVVGMANSGANTNGSQFFIVTDEYQSSLDGKYTAFGKVVSGMDVVQQIEKVDVDKEYKPLANVMLVDVIIK